jgi:hypothetical protein
MVRLIKVVRKGKTEWIEDAPMQCAEGHRELVPTYTGCPVCNEPCRQWQCRAEGCTAPVLVDDEHVHNSRR